MSIETFISLSTINELNNIINNRKKRIISEIWNKYLRKDGISIDELYSRYLNYNKVKIKIKKQNNNKTLVSNYNPDKCMAKLWDNKTKQYYQCSRNPKDDDVSYCMTHIIKRNYGSINILTL